MSRPTRPYPGPHVVNLVLPIVTPSQNETRAWHWSKVHRHNNELILVLRSAVNKAGGRHRMPNRFVPQQKPSTQARVATGRAAHVHVHVHSFRHATLDQGNLVGGCKGLIDALVKEGFLVDDSPAWVTEAYDQQIDRKNKKTVLTLSWVEPEPGEEQQPEDSPTEATRPLPVETTPAKGDTMIKTNDAEAFLSKIEVRSAVPPADENSPVRVKCRVKLELPVPEAEIKAIPFISSAVKAILKASKKVEEGKNSYRLTVKRDFGHATYTVGAHGDAGPIVESFDGEVALQPKVSIVENEVQLSWSVDTIMDLDRLRTLAGLVQMDGVTLTTKVTQQTLDFEAEKKKRAKAKPKPKARPRAKAKPKPAASNG